jgi:DNA replication protein DnaC
VQEALRETGTSPGCWGETFSDDVVAAAMIDRLVHHAEVLTLTGDSYRTRARRELLAKDRAGRH